MKLKNPDVLPFNYSLNKQIFKWLPENDIILTNKNPDLTFGNYLLIDFYKNEFPIKLTCITSNEINKRKIFIQITGLYKYYFKVKNEHIFPKLSPPVCSLYFKLDPNYQKSFENWYCTSKDEKFITSITF
jgi:hypothetical protein